MCALRVDSAFNPQGRRCDVIDLPRVCVWWLPALPVWLLGLWQQRRVEMAGRASGWIPCAVARCLDRTCRLFRGY